VTGPSLFAVLALMTLLVVPFNLLPWGQPRAKAVSPQDDPPRRHAPPAGQTIYAPSIGVEGFGEAELVLNNNSPKPMEVTPTFFTAEGNAIPGEKVTLKPTEVQHVNVIDLMLPEHRALDKMGGMSLRYFGGMLEVGAQITLLGKTGSVDIPFSSMKDYRSSVQEAVWWMPENGVATIVLGNASDDAVTVNLTFSTGVPQIIQLGPHATEIVQYRPVASAPGTEGGSAESVRLEVSGPRGSVRATGFVTTNDQSVAGAIRFYDPATIRQPHLFATHLRVKGTTPHLVLKNTTDAPMAVRPRFIPLSALGPDLKLDRVTVEPHQAVEVDLTPLTTAAARRRGFEVVSVQVMNESGRVGLIGALCGRQSATGTTYDVPLRDSWSGRKSTGSYPWRVDGDYTTIISITNTGEKPAKFAASISEKHGQYLLEEQELAVGETAVFNIKKIRDEQIPDRDGYQIPRSATIGQFRWSVRGSEGTERLIGRSEVVSLSKKVSSTYSCQICCPMNVVSYFLQCIDFPLTPNESANFLASVRLGDCYGRVVGPYSGYADECSVDNPYVLSARVNSSHNITATGRAEGGAAVTSFYDETAWYFDSSIDECVSYLANHSASCSCDVQKPDRIKVASDTGQGVKLTCSNGVQVINRRITYQVIDTSRRDIRKSGISIYEDLYVASSCTGNPVSGGSTLTDSQGRFTDQLTTGCNAKCTSSSTCSVIGSQYWVAPPHGDIARDIPLDIGCFVSRVNGSLQLATGTIMPK
jgi:hypothetical protein